MPVMKMLHLEAESQNLLVRFAVFSCYLVAGALIFQGLEYSNEKKSRENVKKALDEAMLRFDINATEMAKLVRLLSDAEDHGYFENWKEHWCFTGSLFFSGTVITTIGYGHLTPATFGGRIFCMCYAMFGIPMTWLLLQAMGKRVIKAIMYFLQLVDSTCLRREPTNIDLKCACILFIICLLLACVIAVLGMYTENWFFNEGFYFAFISLTTIGFGDFVPQHPHTDGEPLSYVWIATFLICCLVIFTFGLSMASSFLMLISVLLERETLLGSEFFKVPTEDQHDHLDEDEERGGIREEEEEGNTTRTSSMSITTSVSDVHN